MADKYAMAVDTSVGTVKSRARTVIDIDVQVNMGPAPYEREQIPEYVLMVNGHVVKRMNLYQAQRLGIVEIDR